MGNIWMSFKVHFKKCIKLINQDNNNLAELVVDLLVSFVINVEFSFNKHEAYTVDLHFMTMIIYILSLNLNRVINVRVKYMR